MICNLILAISLFSLDAPQQVNGHRSGTFGDLLLQLQQKGRQLHVSTRPPYPSMPTGAAQAAQYRYKKRLGSLSSIPINAVIEAKKDWDNLPQMQAYGDPLQDDAGIYNWQELGPKDVGGRVRSILMLDTNNILIGSVSGGIWKTTDQGQSWNLINDFMPTLSISSLTRDASNGNQIYAGTGEVAFGNGDAVPGAGVFRSLDGGNTWTQMANTSAWRFCRLFAHPFLANEVYAAVGGSSSEDGVWKSTNGGQNWTRVLATTEDCIDVKVDTEAWLDVVACTMRADNADVWFSNNGGMGWALQTVGGSNKIPLDVGRCEVAFGGSDGSIYISADRNGGEIYRSMDGTVTWQLRHSGSNYLGSQGWYANTIWVAKNNWQFPITPTNQELVIVGGLDLYRSIDGGSNLTKISDWALFHLGNSAHADHHVIVPSPNFNTTLPIPNREVWFANDGGIQRTLNIDTVLPAFNWNNMNNGLGITQFYAGSAGNNGGYILGGTQDNDTLVRTLNGGPTDWTQFKTGDGGFCAIDPIDPIRMYGTYIYLDVYGSNDHGQTWVPKINGLTDAGDDERALFIAPLVHDPNNSFILYGGGRQLWKTTNGANSWSSTLGSLTNDPLISAIAVGKQNSNTVYVGYTRGQLLRSDNGGSSWTVCDGPLDNVWITDIAINPFNNSDVVITYGGFETNRVYRSFDGGLTFQNRSGTTNPIPAINVNSVIFHPKNGEWLYIGTDLGILASDDGGVNWNRTPYHGGTIDHEGPVNVVVDDLFFDANDYLYAATHGRGMWRSYVPAVIYIDKNHPGPFTGSEQNPFNRVDNAINQTGPAHLYSIKANTYNEGAKVYSKRGKFIATGGTAVIK